MTSERPAAVHSRAHPWPQRPYTETQTQLMLPILTSLALLAAPQAVAPVGVLQQLDIPAAPEGLISFPVELEGQAVNLILEPYSIRAADFQLFATSPDGSVVEMPAPAAKTWRGFIEGREDSMVTASITREGLSACLLYTSTLPTNREV